MRTVGSLMNEIGAALQFFLGFGENWHALKECLSYLDEWLPGQAYVLLVEQAEEVLVGEAVEELGFFLRVLDEVGQFWSAPITDNSRFDRAALPFHVLLLFEDEPRRGIGRYAAAAREAGIRYRV